MDVKCPNCGTHYDVAEQQRGRKALCEVCNKKFIIGESFPDADSMQKSDMGHQTIKCPHCGTEYEIDPDEIGESAKCEACGNRFIIRANKGRIRTASQAATHFGTQTKKIPRKSRSASVTASRPNYADNKVYFQPKVDSPGCGCLSCIALMFVFALACICSGKIETALVGLGLLVVGIILVVQIIQKMSPNANKPTDQSIDMQAQAMGRGLDEIAFGKLGIDPDEVSSAEPLRFWGYRFESPSVLGDDDDNSACWVLGEDGNYRSSEVAHTIFFFGENSVYCFERTASLVGTSLRDSTEEYFYKDIVSVKTDTTNVPNRGKGVTVRTDEFILTNTGGERRVCAVENSATASAAVSAFRALLKQKKI